MRDVKHNSYAAAPRVIRGRINQMKYTYIYVKSSTEMDRAAADAINTWAAGAGYASTYKKEEVDDLIRVFEREIASGHPDVAENLSIETEELDDEE